ncbi:hypothetical protein D3C87_1670350 [compost metagenome]
MADKWQLFELLDDFSAAQIFFPLFGGNQNPVFMDQLFVLDLWIFRRVTDDHKIHAAINQRQLKTFARDGE